MSDRISTASILTCHQVFVDPSSANVTLLGIFTRLQMSKFPSPMTHFCVYFMLEGDPGEIGEVQVDIVASTTDTLLRRERTRFQLGAEGKRQMNCRFGELSFPVADRYVIRLQINGMLIAEQSLLVVGK